MAVTKEHDVAFCLQDLQGNQVNVRLIPSAVSISIKVKNKGLVTFIATKEEATRLSGWLADAVRDL